MFKKTARLNNWSQSKKFLFCFLIHVNSMFLEVEPSETLKLADKNKIDWFPEGPVIEKIISKVKQVRAKWKPTFTGNK